MGIGVRLKGQSQALIEVRDRGWLSDHRRNYATSRGATTPTGPEGWVPGGTAVAPYGYLTGRSHLGLISPQVQRWSNRESTTRNPSAGQPVEVGCDPHYVPLHETKQDLTRSLTACLKFRYGTSVHA